MSRSRLLQPQRRRNSTAPSRQPLSLYIQPNTVQCQSEQRTMKSQLNRVRQKVSYPEGNRYILTGCVNVKSCHSRGVSLLTFDEKGLHSPLPSRDATAKRRHRCLRPRPPAGPLARLQSPSLERTDCARNPALHKVARPDQSEQVKLRTSFSSHSYYSTTTTSCAKHTLNRYMGLPSQVLRHSR